MVHAQETHASISTSHLDLYYGIPEVPTFSGQGFFCRLLMLSFLKITEYEVPSLIA